MVAFPPAKINLGLRVTHKRADGYHALESVFYPIALCDVLEIVVAPTGQTEPVRFIPSGLAVDGHPKNNLVLKAIQLFDSCYKLPPLEVYLHKAIPMGAGLGGGSSDAAWTLRVLNELMGKPLPFEKLLEMAAALGSDCPFFMFDSPCKVQGRGELLEPFALNLNGLHLALINPSVHVSTVAAFGMIKPQKPAENLFNIIKLPISEWQGRVLNDFELPISQKYTEVAQALEVLKEAGAIYYAMSGSGSTVFGLFKSSPQFVSLPKNWMFYLQEL
jgi:4-diphosphocytidyl-2-C-methyl-D-erythritol kinase